MVDSRVPARNPSCAELTAPTVPVQAHSAPLGLAFYDGEQFPAAYRGRSVRGLPRLVEPEPGDRVQGGADQVHQRAGAATTGFRAWLADRAPRGPADRIGAGRWSRWWVSDGSLYVTDDRTNAIYRISYVG